VHAVHYIRKNKMQMGGMGSVELDSVDPVFRGGGGGEGRCGAAATASGDTVKYGSVEWDICTRRTWAWAQRVSGV
jgi:hypothetical protein